MTDTPAAPAATDVPADPASQKHPRGLYILFAAEAWERFSYYGMRALLTLYLVNQLHYERADALAVYGLYTSLVYLTPIFGGQIADRLLGQRKSVIIGGVVMALGHLAMAFEPLLHVALGLLIVGNGFFKPNISTIVGGLYKEGDPRRDGGFTIFYMGINLGAFFSPLVCGTLGENIGWHWGFGAAGIGMIFGLGVFLAGQRLLGPVGWPPKSKQPGFVARDFVDIALWIVGSCLLVVGFLQLWQRALGPIWAGLGGGVQSVIIILAVLSVIVFVGSAVWSAHKIDHFTKNDWQCLAVIAILTFFNIFFWMGFEQAGGTMTLFADEQTDRHLFGWEIPASYFQSINPLGIVVMAPIFSALWIRFDAPGSKLATSTPMKMALGMITLGLGFIVMYVAQQIAVASGNVGPLWLATVYFIHTLGELMLSPIGLSMVTKLAPPRLGSLMMGLWFVSSAVANYFAGNLEAIVEEYHLPVYGVLIATSIGAGVVLIALTPVLKRWMHGRG